MKLKVKNVIEETKDAVSICFNNGNFFKKIKYKPGQFLTIHVPIDGVVHKRAYSFSSNPFTDRNLKITIKRVEKGLVSNYVHDHIREGDRLVVDDPAGSFIVEPNKRVGRQYVLFAGGSGVTPIFSILKAVLSEEFGSNILLIYANQNMDSIIFHDEIKSLENNYPDRFSVEHIISSIKADKGNYHYGLATKGLIDAIFKKHNLSYEDYHYMICGPFGYMDSIKNILRENGISRDKIMVEVFNPATVKLTGKNLVSDVTLSFEGKKHQFKVRRDKSILQEAMSGNVVIPYSCRSGMCSTCKAKCVEGEVKMIDGHFLPESEVENGAILTCVSYPISEKVVLEI
ncbi:2Fe-2S iron-sulfur cluster-binding protein [Flavisericum labens]|uniref:2Fe-2S iron-sulfur cluster-binding protein n=1 Tax=Flavisericum labens TaxID=3377112 RepID=UPI00387ACA33